MKTDHSVAIPTGKIAEALSKIEEAIALILPYTITLTPTQRHEMPKMGDKTLSFVLKSFELSKQNTQFNPSYLKLEDFEIDIQDAVGLRTVRNLSQQLTQILSDTAMSAGSEAYQTSLIYYNSVKYAASQNVPGAKAIYEELRKRFPGTKSKKQEPKTEE